MLRVDAVLPSVRPGNSIRGQHCPAVGVLSKAEAAYTGMTGYAHLRSGVAVLAVKRMISVDAVGELRLESQERHPWTHHFAIFRDELRLGVADGLPDGFRHLQAVVVGPLALNDEPLQSLLLKRSPSRMVWSHEDVAHHVVAVMSVVAWSVLLAVKAVSRQ